jgi:uncharacterized protein with PIN domain
VKRTDQPDFSVRLNFHESLRFFLPKNTRGSLSKILHEKTSVKDAIESCGVPHPEVDLILIDGSPVDFAFQLRREHEGEILGVHDSPERFENARLQTRGIARFVADGHLGKLARFLRLLGIDVVYDRSADDRKLLDIAVAENRALLTRDRRLLMHSIVQHGYYPRSQIPDEQVLEVVRRFELSGLFTPYTRCLHCNTALDSVGKSEIFSQLEPLTQIYYEDFRRCAGCGKIYWAGSHFPKLQARIASLRKQLQLTRTND